MKKYIQPTTQVIQTELQTIICLSIAGEENQENAMAPSRQSGPSVKLTTLYI